MIRKMMLFMIPIGLLGLLLASQWQDVIRYLKIKQMSMGGGHPENVPATGKHQYPSP